jgi:hypothetical protein
MNLPDAPFHPWRKLSRQDYLQLLQHAYTAQDFSFAAQVALDWLSDFPGDLPFRYWYGNARAKAGHLTLAANILDEVLQQDPEYLEALQTRLEIERQLAYHRTKSTSSQPFKSAYSLSDYQEWLIALEGYDTPTLKRPYTRLEGRWGEEIYPLRKSLAHSETLSNQTFLQEFQNQFKQVLAAKPDHPLIAITHLQSLILSYRAGFIPLQSLRQLVDHYRHAFPDCLYIGYVAVEIYMENGENEQAVAVLHSLAARDLTAQVARRLWQPHHPFLEIWPKKLEKQLSIAVPASVAALLGWNQLPHQVSELTTLGIDNRLNSDASQEKSLVGEKSNERSFRAKDALPSTEGHLSPQASSTRAKSDNGNTTFSEELREIQETFDQIGARLKQQNTMHIDGRQPVYVAMSNQSQLIRYLGEIPTKDILEAVLRMLDAIQTTRGWRGILYLIDKGLNLSIRKNSYSIEPITQNDPWAIKRGLQQLDSLLAKQGEMIGAVLIVGPHEIIPFHRLPNPLEDGDAEVFSDNPYGSRDENYLVMDWPVGRLPCSLHHPEDWLTLLENLTTPYQRNTKSKAKPKGYAKSLAPLWSWVQYLLSLFQPTTCNFSSFGYTAAAWRFASFAVFRQIGNPQAMLISPQLVKKLRSAETAKRRLVRHTKAFGTLEEVPVKLSSESQPILSKTEQIHIPSATAGYFNLHGLADSPEWFGQSDPTESSDTLVATADHPVALQPGDILLNPESGMEIIFSEACFGAYTSEKDPSTSLALAFLKKGCRAFVGSTSTSYGSNGTPLIAADYLAYEFWKYLRQGLPAGECLRQAKLSMARELSKTYGYLDGEDQKTLISFVLYGDPLAQVSPLKSSPKVVRHSKSIVPNLVSTCDHAFQPHPEELTPQLESMVKKLVEKHLPGMEFSKVEVLSESGTCLENCSLCGRQEQNRNSFSPSSENAKRKPTPSRKIIILTRQERRKEHIYTQYARLTLDEKGRLIRLSLSR